MLAACEPGEADARAPVSVPQANVGPPQAQPSPLPVVIGPTWLHAR